MAKPEEDFSKIEIRPWIKKKLAHYAETPRAGVPRGEELPIPRHKYHAALLMLMYGSKAAPNLWWIAKETGTTYTLVGKWRNERKFKKLIRDLAEEFMAGWFEFFIWLCNETSAHKGTKEDAAHENFIDRMMSICHNTWGEPLQISFHHRALDFIEKNPNAATNMIRLVQVMEGWIWSNLSAKKKNVIIDFKKKIHELAVERLKVLAVQAVEGSDKEAARRLIDTFSQMMLKLGNSYWELARSMAVKEKAKA